MFAGSRKILPETLRHARAVNLLQQRGKNLPPLSDGFRARALFVVCQSQAIVDGGSTGRQLQRVLVIGNGASSVSAVEVIVRDSKVARDAGGAFFENCGTAALRVAVPGDTGIFARAGAVVKPDVAGKLLASVNRLWLAISDGVISESSKERGIHFRCSFRKIESEKGVVRARPDGRALTATQRNQRMRL